VERIGHYRALMVVEVQETPVGRLSFPASAPRIEAVRAARALGMVRSGSGGSGGGGGGGGGGCSLEANITVGVNADRVASMVAINPAHVSAATCQTGLRMRQHMHRSEHVPGELFTIASVFNSR